MAWAVGRHGQTQALLAGRREAGRRHTQTQLVRRAGQAVSTFCIILSCVENAGTGAFLQLPKKEACTLLPVCYMCMLLSV